MYKFYHHYSMLDKHHLMYLIYEARFITNHRIFKYNKRKEVGQVNEQEKFRLTTLSTKAG